MILDYFAKKRSEQISKIGKERRKTEPSGFWNGTKFIKWLVNCSARGDLRYWQLLTARSCSFTYQNSHIFGTDSKLQAACQSMFTTIITSQEVIVMCRETSSDYGISSTSTRLVLKVSRMSSHQARTSTKRPWKTFCANETTTRFASWDLEETLLIGDKGASSSTVSYKTDTLHTKPVRLFVGRLLPGSSLVSDHIPCDVEIRITRSGRVHIRS